MRRVPRAVDLRSKSPTSDHRPALARTVAELRRLSLEIGVDRSPDVLGNHEAVFLGESLERFNLVFREGEGPFFHTRFAKKLSGSLPSARWSMRRLHRKCHQGYCAEQFDGTLLSSIVKNLKRVMAAEYSRELSVKVHAGNRSGARLPCSQPLSSRHQVKKRSVGQSSSI